MWDFPSLLLYIGVSFIGTMCIHSEKSKEKTCKVGVINRYYLLFFILWTALATFRYVGYYKNIVVGGMDAPMYKEFFEISRSATKQNLYSYHTESLFQLYTKIIRFFTDDYHVYFAISYGFIVFSYLIFIKEFKLAGSHSAALFMLIFVYLKSFCVFRTHLAIAVILISLVLVKKNKLLLACMVALTTPFIQRASVFFALFPLFYILFKKKRIDFRKGLLLVVAGMVIGVAAQRIALAGSYSWMLGGAYQKYARASLSAGYAIDYVKLIIEQLLMVALMVHYNKNIETIVIREKQKGNYAPEILKIVMIYDAMLIPISYVLNIWRGVDYFFLPRLIMIDIIVDIFGTRVTQNSKKIYRVCIWGLMIVWFVFRMSTTYDKSALMPYIFESISNL